ncbi:MAG: ABC transporter permease [Thermoguttaceae bacterium]
MSDELPPINRDRFRRIVRLMADYLGLLGVLGVLIVFFSLKSERFLSAETFSMLANQVPTLAVIAAGMTFVLVVAGIDLSVGSVMAFCGAVLGVAMVDWGWSMPLAVALCLAAGLGCGLVNGLITVRWAIPSFIVTLGMLEMIRGGAYLVTHSETKFIGVAIEPVATPMAGIGLSPAFVLALLVVLLGQFTLTRTRFGRYVIAVGANEQAARLSGIDPRRIKVIVFAMAGLMAGLGGWFQTSRMATADPNAGVGLELSAIAAVVIGGTSLMGGRGSVINSFFGVLIIAVLESGLASIGAEDPTKRLVTGAVIIVAVIADAYRHRLAGRRDR